MGAGIFFFHFFFVQLWGKLRVLADEAGHVCIGRALYCTAMYLASAYHNICAYYYICDLVLLHVEVRV